MVCCEIPVRLSAQVLLWAPIHFLCLHSWSGGLRQKADAVFKKNPTFDL